MAEDISSGKNDTAGKNNTGEAALTPLMELENRHTSGIYSKRKVSIVRGEGAILYDEQGKRYVDMTSGFGVALVGYGNPYLAEAIAKQANTLNVCHEIFYNDIRAQLLEKLASVTPDGLDRFFLCSSGAEAVEGALKFARLATGRKEIIATMKGFHGRTFGALSATWSERYREPFKPLVPEFTHVPFNRIDEITAAISERTAAVLIEVIQGEGGINPGSTEYFQELRKLCDERGVLLIFDEIQTGLGRTGKWFACQHHDVVPDMMCLAKGIAGGVPMGAVAIGPRLGEFPKAIHGTTFGGNPVSCSAALATLQFIQDNNLIERSREMGEYILGKLESRKIPLVRRIKGKGLMLGIELKRKSQEFISKLMDKGVLAIPAGTTVIRLLPPLVIEKEDVDFALEKIEEVLTPGG